MANRPPFDPDAPPPGGFNPRFGRDGPGRPQPIRDEGPRFDRDFDRRGGPERDPFEPGRDRRSGGDGGGPSRPARIWLILGGLLILGAIIFGLTLTRSGAGSDAIGGNSEATATNEDVAEAAQPQDRCAAPATYDLLKRQLFRQAAATRGSDQATFDSLAGYASVRVSGPTLRDQDQGLERISCGADVALDLPPGLQVTGGRRTLTASLTYDLQPSADGSGDVMTLRGAEGITVPLATLARTSSAPRPTVPVPTSPDSDNPSAAVPDPEPAPPPVPAEPAATSAARPSFNCARARTSGEIAVCQSDSLAALDRQMASYYVDALRGADGEQRALLQRTRDRFLGYRDRCTTDRCIADAYRGRITEIGDIVEGRWRGR
ncbi:hypothetical protein GCM10022281_22100 [Sphingomonas rosea]|uniref:Lysozyme inhibitor LprI N-terminal domain-containing protein n=1 Tax=Sphingomonas rosea TaxID=335605 RepID=A0ABP7UCY9_9SPHN